MEPLLAIAEELERRDAEAAEALAEVERLQYEVDELRTDAGAVAAFLRELPAARAALDAEDRESALVSERAAAALVDAEAALDRARGDNARLDAARAVQHARDAAENAELRVASAQQERARLDDDAAARAAEAEELERRGAALAQHPRLERSVVAPATGLHGLLDWASLARGELLLTHAALATDREKLVREASELVASVLGDPLATATVAGLRERLAGSL